MPPVEFLPSIPQQLAYDHLWAKREALLFMGCGLGKTATVLHTIRDKLYDGASKGALIVAPLRVCNLTWPAELRKWAGLEGLRMVSLRTPEGMKALQEESAHLYVINYDMLQQFQERYLSGRRKLGFDTVVWDELTRAKNHRSVRINAVRGYLRKHCERHWGMTGTPTPNGLLDLFAQVRLIDGGARLGPAYGAYRDTYFEAKDWQGYDWQPKEGARERIYHRIADLALTLKSSDWLDIPDTVVEDVDVALAPEAREQYKELERELLLLLKEGDAAIIAVNAAVLSNKLIQVTSGAVYDEARNTHHIHDGKIKALQGLVKRLKGKPVLIAYSYQHELARIRAALPGAVSFADARTETQQLELVRRWNAGKIPALLAHPKSVAHGLNMQDGGSTVIWFTLPWSPEDYHQLNSRLARRGQDEVTTVYRLVTTGTVEEAVVESLRSKDGEQANLLDALRVWAEAA